MHRNSIPFGLLLFQAVLMLDLVTHGPVCSILSALTGLPIE